MTRSKSLGVTSKEIQEFTSFQRTIFLSKAEFSSPKFTTSSEGIKYKEMAKSIFKLHFNSSPRNIEKLGPSTLHTVYKLEGSKNAVVKLNKIPKVYREFHFVIEQWIMMQCKKNSLPFYAIYAFDISRKYFLTDYSLSEYITDTSMYTYVKEGKAFLKLFKKLGSLTASIHAIPTEKYGPLSVDGIQEEKGRGVYNQWGDYIHCNLEEHLKICLQKKILNKAEIQVITKMFQENNHVLKHIKPSLLHGDLATHNVFTNGKEITALIDWEDAVSGDSVYDLAFFKTGCFNHPEWFEAFLEGYISIRALPSDFLDRIRLYYLRIAVAKAVVRVRDGTLKDVNKPSPRERILHSIASFTVS